MFLKINILKIMQDVDGIVRQFKNQNYVHELHKMLA